MAGGAAPTTVAIIVLGRTTGRTDARAVLTVGREQQEGGVARLAGGVAEEELADLLELDSRPLVLFVSAFYDMTEARVSHMPV